MFPISPHSTEPHPTPLRPHFTLCRLPSCRCSCFSRLSCVFADGSREHGHLLEQLGARARVHLYRTCRPKKNGQIKNKQDQYREDVYTTVTTRIGIRTTTTARKKKKTRSSIGAGRDIQPRPGKGFIKFTNTSPVLYLSLLVGDLPNCTHRTGYDSGHLSPTLPTRTCSINVPGKVLYTRG